MRLHRSDPLAILLRRESRTCKGCKHELSDTVFGKTLTVCTFITNSGKRGQHGRRCKSYQEQINGND